MPDGQLSAVLLPIAAIEQMTMVPQKMIRMILRRLITRSTTMFRSTRSVKKAIRI